MLLLSACGNKLEKAAGLNGTGGGNGAGGTFQVAAQFQCNLLSAEVLAKDASNITIRAKYSVSRGVPKAKAVTLTGGNEISLNTGAAGVQCLATDKTTQLLTFTVPTTSPVQANSISLKVYDSAAPADMTICSAPLLQGDAFANTGLACQSASSTNSATDPAYVTMSTSQFGTLARVTVASSNKASIGPTDAPISSQPTSYVGVVDYGNGAPYQPIPVGMSLSAPLGAETVLPADPAAPAGTFRMRVVMFGTNGRTMVTKNVTLGAVATATTQHYREDGKGQLNPFTPLVAPNLVAQKPTSVFVVGHEEDSSAPNMVVGYHAPTGQKIFQNAPFAAVPETARRKQGIRVALGDLDGSGNLSLIATQEQERYLEIYNGASPQTLRSRTDLNEFSTGETARENFNSSGATVAVVELDNSGMPQLIITTRRRTVTAGRMVNGVFSKFMLSNVEPLDDLDGEMRVAGLGGAMMFTDTGADRGRGRFFRRFNDDDKQDAADIGKDASVTLGYNSPASKEPIAIVGKGNSGEVMILNAAAAVEGQFMAFSNSPNGVQVSTADVNNDGVSDIIVASNRDTRSSAAPSRVAVFDGKTNAKLFEVTPFAAFKGGLYVAGHLPARKAP